MGNVKDFLNPKAALTPGIAGSIAMLLANSLWVAFGLPQAWTALAVSFLFALLVGASTSAPLWQRSIYVVLNSLVIFSVGLGGNALGAGSPSESVVQHRSALHRQLTLALAEAQQAAPPPSAAELKRLQEELQRKDNELRELREKLKKGEPESKSEPKEPAQTQTPQGGQRKFFQHWKF